jgi:branched-chain amino acid transport system permease protein
LSVSKRTAYSIFAALAFAAALTPFYLSIFSITLLNYIGIATLISLGLVLLTGSGGMTSFGQAAFVGIGAYTTAYLSTSIGCSPWTGLVVALAATFLIAIIIGAATLHLGGHYLPITTIAWGLSIYLLFGNFEALGRYGGLSHIPPISVFGYALERMDQIYYLIWVIVGASLVAAFNLLSSREGRAIRALRGGSALVESLGVNSFRTKLAVFVISALLAALAGWLYAHMQRFISPTTFGLSAGIEYLLMAMLGGAGYVGGALVGAIAVTVLKDWLQDLLTLMPSNGGNLEAVAFGVIFILLLQYSPRGLVPLAARYLPHRRRDDALELFVAGRELSRRAIPTAGAPLLTIENLTKKFGGLTAVDEVSFKVEAGMILALIGPNGAGKSTIFNLVTGALTPTSGRVFFAGSDITGLRQRVIAESGIARTFQHVKLRPEMSVLENVMLGAYLRTTSGFISGCLKLDRNAELAVTALALEKLHEVGLDGKAAIHAGNLPLGQQRIVEIARALAADPVMIMLDEPAAGLRSREKQELSNVLRSLRARGVTILLVEHDMPFLMGLADRVVVLDFGRKIAEDMPAEVRANPKVQEAYLGGVA